MCLHWWDVISISLKLYDRKKIVNKNSIIFVFENLHNNYIKDISPLWHCQSNIKGLNSLIKHIIAVNEVFFQYIKNKSSFTARRNT